MRFDWTSGEPYHGLVAAGRAALAWELLRRDPGYASTVSDADAAVLVGTDAAFVAQWGLHFR